jgi:non-homologous end joining protein Ku
MSQYKDEYVQLVRDAVEKKMSGEELTVSAEVKTKDIFDLHAALTASLESIGEKKKAKKTTAKKAAKKTAAKKRKAG